MSNYPMRDRPEKILTPAEFEDAEPTLQLKAMKNGGPRVCPYCHATFYRLDSRVRYCSDTCKAEMLARQNREGQRKWKQKHAEFLANIHE